MMQNFTLRELWILSLGKLGVPVSRLQILKLRRIGTKAKSSLRAGTLEASNIRVAYGPTLPTWTPSLLFDKALIEALELEGATLIPFYCDQSQFEDCSVSLDKWRSKPFSKECRDCAQSSRTLWLGKSPIGMSKIRLDAPDKAHLKIIAEMKIESLEEFAYHGIDLGKLAKKLISNGNLSENPSLASDYQGKLVRHIQNLAHIVDEAEKFIESYSPHRWVLNDTTYGMWAVVSQVAQKHNIEVYNAYPLTKTKTVVGRNAPAIEMDFRREFSGFKGKRLSDLEESQIDHWLGGSRDEVLSTSNTKPKTAEARFLESQGSSLAVIAANICWDAASLGKQMVFKSMIEWVTETARWYSERPNLRLIVRAHPAETNPMIPKTVETVPGAILDFFDKVPANVTLSMGSDQQPWLELLDEKRPDVVLVNTSTAGLEAAVKGYPVVVTGAAPYRLTDFVASPETPQQYFSLLESFHGTPSRMNQIAVREARSFLSYYQFRYQTDYRVFSGNPPSLSPNVEEVLSNESSELRLLARKIIASGPRTSATPWAHNLEDTFE